MKLSTVTTVPFFVSLTVVTVDLTMGWNEQTMPRLQMRSESAYLKFDVFKVWPGLTLNGLFAGCGHAIGSPSSLM